MLKLVEKDAEISSSNSPSQKKVLNPLPDNLNPKIFLEYEELLKEKFIKKMRLLLVDLTPALRNQTINQSKKRMVQFSGLSKRELDNIFREVEDSEKLLLVLHEISTKTAAVQLQ